MLKWKPRALKRVPFNLYKNLDADNSQKVNILEARTANSDKKWSLCNKKVDVLSAKRTRQSEQLIDDYAHFLSLSLVHGQVPLTSLTIRLTDFHLITAQQWYDISVTTMCLLPDATLRRAATVRSGRDRCKSICRKIHSRRCCFPFDSRSEKTRPSQRPSITIELGTLSLDEGDA